MNNPYVDFALVMQAIRRRVEQRIGPLCGALGVRAKIYSHQIANVSRILTSEQVRHLLADEVGLGKTVQALMVVNALRLQRPELKVMILVPDRLVPQWRDEILTRTHLTPIEHIPGPNETRRIRLAWPETVDTSEISAGDYDMLVVDELHQLTTNLQDRVVQESPMFQHLLILTATPNFRSAIHCVRLFAALEPTRIVLASVSVANTTKGREAGLAENRNIANWPEWALLDIVTEFLSRDVQVSKLLNGVDAVRSWECYGGAPPEDGRNETAALANCAYRRVIRTRRKDYKGLLPQRLHRPIVVEPTHSEVERQRLMWNYFEHLGGLTREFDPIRLAKRVILSAPSLRQRVTFLRGRGHERNGLLYRVAQLLSDDHGDSRLDALTDLLSAIWRNNPEEQVLVAAQDNLTVDYLFKVIPARLPEIGPRTARVRLIPARVRQGMTTEAVDDLAGFANETDENLGVFQRRESQVLFAPEAVQVGLNLQCARVIVLYSVPWSPEEVEQWIGRLDRIGNTAVQAENGGALPVEIFTIVQRGLVDERVVSVLQRYRVFDQTINLDGEHLQEIADRIEAAALDSNGIGWGALERDVVQMAQEDTGDELLSDLRQHLPWGAKHAKQLRDWIEEIPPLKGALRESHPVTGPLAWDRAVEGWVWMLRKAGEYDIRLSKRETDSRAGRFSTLWYSYGSPLPWNQGTEVRSQVHLEASSGVDNPQLQRSAGNALAFFTRRRDIEQPPRREVHITIGSSRYRRPLHFLNHGDPLHEDLVSGWLDMADKVPERIALELPGDHEAISVGGSGLYVVRVTVVDPANCLPAPDDEVIIRRVAKSATRLSAEQRVRALIPLAKKLTAAIEADGRWVRGLLPTLLLISVSRFNGDRWHPVSENVVDSLLNPYSASNARPPVSRRWIPERNQEKKIMEAFGMLADHQRLEARAAWSTRLSILDREIKRRSYIAAVEGNDDSLAQQLRVGEAKRRLGAATASGVRLTIGRAQSDYNTAADIAAFEESACGERLKWLQALEHAVRSPNPVSELEIGVNLSEQR